MAAELQFVRLLKVKRKHKLHLLGGMRISENDGPVNKYLLCLLLAIIGNRCEWGVGVNENL